MHCEELLSIHPMKARHVAGSVRQFLELGDRVLVRILRMYRFAGAKMEDASRQRYALLAHAYEVHLDASKRSIIESMMAKGIEVEVGTEFAIDAHEQIEVELGGNVLGVVVGRVKQRGVLLEIHANQHAARGPGDRAAVGEKCGGLGDGEVPDRGAGKIDHQPP